MAFPLSEVGATAGFAAEDLTSFLTDPPPLCRLVCSSYSLAGSKEKTENSEEPLQSSWGDREEAQPGSWGTGGLKTPSLPASCACVPGSA